MGEILSGSRFQYSESIENNFLHLATDCLAVVDTGPDKLCVTSDRTCDAGSPAKFESFTKYSENKIVSEINLLDLETRQINEFQFGCTQNNSSETADWVGFECIFQAGERDKIFFHNPAKLLRQDEFSLGLLNAAWPLLRKDCVSEFAATEQTSTNDALMWFVAQKIDLALVVFNSAGLMLRMNRAARRVLETEEVLRRSPQGIVAVNEQETTAFRTAIAACAETDNPVKEQMIFLSYSDSGKKVPVTISRYLHKGKLTRLAVMMMPVPPAPERIEEIARTQGLTSAEAKAATLMQLGLTNKEAAQRAGLKEGTFNTYAKRALSKLSVSGRAEMAQLLTWQSAGRLTV